MIKKTAAKRKIAKSANMLKAARNSVEDTFATVESLLRVGSPQRVTAGIVAAAGGALLAAAALGVGPAALAGAAGYVVYREMSGARKHNQVGLALHKH
jgi:hypothetical protein